MFDNVVLSGIGSLQYTGTSILMSQPETGALITEYTLDGGVAPHIRTAARAPGTKTTASFTSR